ncbi:TraM recognition domain-containing protein [Rhodovulum sulfidophilum]|uniref:TraM recognition domain-containing protein n=1 Tax=Rhodovulum sulfidophilum TaxID=35806 RepID=A0ABS1S074_RHOSU|nr:TraM recognition domain-containing protein [Rhodovulum sulfidophilum]MBL3611182.1 TraM recognition domain-containing protein [Rhodovulum sulfidophilum]MCE8455725.1 TraG/TraD/VirD4 family protein [Rhodovulum sulfidophilum]
MGIRTTLILLTIAICGVLVYQDVHDRVEGAEAEPERQLRQTRDAEIARCTRKAAELRGLIGEEPGLDDRIETGQHRKYGVQYMLYAQSRAAIEEIYDQEGRLDIEAVCEFIQVLATDDPGLINDLTTWSGTQTVAIREAKGGKFQFAMARFPGGRSDGAKEDPAFHSPERAGQGARIAHPQTTASENGAGSGRARQGRSPQSLHT